MKRPGESAPGVARGFDRLAQVYDPLADLAFAGRIHASQTALLPRLSRARRALVMGGGSGRFLCELLAAGHADHAVAIDASPRMTAMTEAGLRVRGLHNRAELRIGGLERLGGDERFDLVVTHCYLDLFDQAEFEGVVHRLAEALLPEGSWLFSDFTTMGGGLPRPAKRAVVALLYAFFRATCGIDARKLPDFNAAFGQLGFRAVVSASAAAGLLRASILKREHDQTHPPR